MEGSNHYVKGVFVQLTERFETPDGITGVKTGIPSLDNAGGLLAGDVIVIAGHPGAGKTSLAVSMCMEAVTAKVPALYVALSERGDQIAERALVQRTSIQNVALRRGLLLRSEMEQLVKAASVVATAPFHIEDGRDMTAVAIRDLVTEWRAQVDAPVAMVVLDYVQLLNGEPNARSNTRDEELAAAVRTLQSAAKESRVVFVLVSQLNRRWAQREDPRPHLVDLRESGSLEGVATAVLFTHPPVAQDLHFEVILAKHRRCAAPQTDEFVFDGANGSFRPFMPAD